MAQDLSIESPDDFYLITTRTIGSRLWFIKNQLLEVMILSFLAKYVSKLAVELYAFILMGNHYHLIVRFPRRNKSRFVQCFNAIVARLVATHVPNLDSGGLWARRARCQLLGTTDDVLHWFFYTALNPVNSGLVLRISDYSLYNSFSDAIHGKTRAFQLLDRTLYNNRKRSNPRVTQNECMETFVLEFKRLPGFEHLSADEYRREMLRQLEERRVLAIKERQTRGLGFATESQIRATKPGDKPQTTKMSSRDSHRPICLSLCRETRKRVTDWYFSVLRAYREASMRYRAGDFGVRFPPGTYKPPMAALPT